jgi:hypothetical protein
MTPKDIAQLLAEDIRDHNGLLLEADHLNLPEILQAHPTLPNVLREYGIDPEKLQILGSGDRGTAFSDGGPYICKITSDLAEAKASLTIQGVDIPGVAKVVYAARLARRVGGEPLYLVIQERANISISAREKKIAGLVGDYLIMQKQWPFDPNEATRKIYIDAYKRTGENLQSPDATNEISQLLGAVLNLHKNGVVYYDVSGENIGKDKKGNYCVFDLGVSTSRGGVLPVVEAILDDCAIIF